MEREDQATRYFMRKHGKRVAAILALLFIGCYPFILSKKQENDEAEYSACRAKCAQHGMSGRMEGRRRLENAPAEEGRNYERDAKCACR